MDFICNNLAFKFINVIKSLIYNYVIHKYYQLEFPGISNDIFTRIREKVDKRIGKVLSESIKKFSAV